MIGSTASRSGVHVPAFLGVAILAAGWLLAPVVRLSADEIDGQELFVREWVPGDSRSHGGDGLGPVFNESSCVACHNQGGVGGGGTNGSNVDLITAFRNASDETSSRHGVFSALGRALFGGGKASPDRDFSPQEVARRKQVAARRERERLAKVHPGFLAARSVVLHHGGRDDGYRAWRSQFTGGHVFGGGAFADDVFEDGVVEELAIEAAVEAAAETSGEPAPFGPSPEPSDFRDALRAREVIAALRSEAQADGFGFFGPSEVDGFVFLKSERNAIALFGAGRIDSIPEAVLVAAAAVEHAGFPEVSGRVARLAGGRAGRFGWKAQVASLEDFVLTACGVELGLHVPGQPQSGDPRQPQYKAPGYDLDQAECSALVRYVAELPQPRARRSSSVEHQKLVDAGAARFGEIGCATCHAPTLGEVDGIYSDLLLHNLGQDLGDNGNYGSFAPDRTDADELDEPIPTLEPEQTFEFSGVVRPSSRAEDAEPRKDLVGATRLEWRTPPLWGLRDSAPYLHDGRAESIEAAIAFHGGEARRSAERFFALDAPQRLEVLAFLKSLAVSLP